MSKEKKNISKEKKNKGPQKPSRLVAFFKGEQGKAVCGLLVSAISAMLGVAFLSFLLTGKDDQAILEHLPWYKVLLPGNGINNWTGTFGAFVSEWCINRWLGIPVIAFVLLFIKMGYEMMHGKELTGYIGKFAKVALWVIWSSLFLSSMCYVLDELFDLNLQSDFIYLGGHHGYDLTQILAANFHIPGLLIILLVLGLILSICMFEGTVNQLRNLFGLVPFFEKRYEAYKEKKEAKQQDVDPEVPGPDDTKTTVSDPEPDPDPEGPTTTVIGPEGPSTTVVVADGPSAPSQPEPPTVVQPVNPPLTLTSPLDPLDGFVVKKGQDDEMVKQPVAQDTEDLELGEYDPTAELSHYVFPGFDLLKAYDHSSPIDMEEQNANKEKIRQTLQDYGIDIQSIQATVGPTITLFEIVLVSGTKISRVKNLSDEIAMSIASKSGIRIIAPIPGKSAIGIEVPNDKAQTVSMRECIASKAFQESRMDLPVALGKTITNEVFTFDLAKAPHLLVAGATGQGKSVGLNAIVTSLLYKKHPSQLKIVLVDPKMVEFSIYKRIEKHYLAKLPDQENPIITDVTKTVDILKSLCAEMEDRYALVEDAGVRNIKEYNEKFVQRKLNPKKHISAPIGSREGTNHRYLPYIVAIIDEYGDLIMTAGKEVELPIARIAQKARAVGIHMIIATQRPSAKIVTGIIKANFPARMAFRVASSIDSSIILDSPGAQSLIGRGDLLFSTGNVPTRVQCAFVDTPEVDRINRFIADQQSFPTALILPEPKIQEGGTDGDGDGSGETVDLHHLDALFDECAQMVVATGQGSTSMIQRKFMIGYNRAGRIMDQLEAAGIVGPYSGSKARAVLVTSDSELAQILDDLKSR